MIESRIFNKSYQAKPDFAQYDSLELIYQGAGQVTLVFHSKDQTLFVTLDKAEMDKAPRKFVPEKVN